MLYFSFALQPEAAPLLSCFSFRSVNAGFGRIYVSDEAIAVITGTGTVATAASLAEAFTLYPPKKQDILINAGICGMPQMGESYTICEESPVFHIGETYRIHKLTDEATGLDFYPDLLLPSVFCEAPLRTVSLVQKNPETLVDMEASAIYRVGRSYFSPDRMFFFKTVSDTGSAFPSKDEVSSLLSAVLPDILSEVTFYGRILQSTTVFSKEDELAIRRFILYTDASVSMEHEIRHLAEYLLHRDGTVANTISDFLAKLPKPLHRREGKLLLEQFRKQCLS